MALEENENAKYICEQVGWLNKETKIMKEIADYLGQHYEQDKIVSFRTISAKLESIGGEIGNYLNNHKQEIIEYALEGNEDASNICKHLGWAKKPVTSEEKIKEIADYLRKYYPQGKIKNYQAISDKLKSTGGAMCNYLHDHKQEIIEMALSKNKDAISICKYIQAFQKDLYKKLDEIASKDSHFQNALNILEESRDKKDGRTVY